MHYKNIYIYVQSIRQYQQRKNKLKQSVMQENA